MQNICFDFGYYFLSIDERSDTKGKGRRNPKRDLSV